MNVRDPFKHMNKMESVLDYLLSHLDEKINIDMVSKMYHYNPVHFARLFLEYFEFPFTRFIVMLRMRKCAKKILETRTLKNVGAAYGYATAASFSKAFRNEFGISPREFLKKSYIPPDMPERKLLNGTPIRLEYKTIPAFSIGGFTYPLKDFGVDEMLTAKVWPSEAPPEALNEGGDVFYGLWHYDENMNPYYLFGPELTKGQRRKKIMTRIRVREADYAVFSFERKETEEDNRGFTRMLGQYISREWIPMNEKVQDSRGYMFARFDPERISLYVPILHGMYGKDIITEVNWQVAEWCRYIDEHLHEDLNVHDLALRWRYSEMNFRMIFSMYYGMDPDEYIQKKRLYLAASAIHKGMSIADVLAEYNFTSREEFEKQFMEEFEVMPEDHKEFKMEALDLIEYYQQYKKSVHIKFRDILPLKAAVKQLDRDEEIVWDQEELVRKEDIPRTAAYWFTHDFDCLKGSDYEMDERERPSRIFIWKNEPVIINGEAVYDYYLGPVVKKDAGIPEGMEELTIDGGTYAVFRTENLSDKDDLPETYRMLTRVAFGGWINECRYRVDYSRPTFINYKRQKLFFYVPIVL